MMTRNMILTSLAVSALMGAAPAGASSLTGLYAGASLGANRLQSELLDTASRTGGKSSDSGMSYDLFGGYGVNVRGPVYVGGELAVGDDAAKTTRSISGGAAKVDPKLRITPSARVGYMPNDRSMIFARAGAQYRDYDVLLPNGQKRSKKLTAPLLGVGYEHAVSDFLSVRGEASFIARKDATFAYGAGGASRLKVEPRESRIEFGAALHF